MGQQIENYLQYLTEGKQGALVALRSAVTAAGTTPTTAQALFSAAAYRYIIVDAKITGTSNVSADLTPMYWNATDAAYFKAEKRTIAASTTAGSDIKERQTFLIPALNVSDFYIFIDGITGTSPSITLYATPYSY